MNIGVTLSVDISNPLLLVGYVREAGHISVLLPDIISYFMPIYSDNSAAESTPE